MIQMVPLNNKKRFHWIPWNLECANFAETKSSKEFHEFAVRQFRWHEQFHGLVLQYEVYKYTYTKPQPIKGV